MLDKPHQLPNDSEFFAALFEQYKNLVYKTAFLMLGEAGEAEDALQEVFILVYRSLNTYDPQKGAVTTWLHRITVNYCLGQHRKHRIRVLPAGDTEPVEALPYNEPGFTWSDEKEAMVQAIHQLDKKLRVMIILRYYWELPYAEIAEILRIPLGTVKSRIDLSIRSLRKVLARPVETRKPVYQPNLPASEEVHPCGS